METKLAIAALGRNFKENNYGYDHKTDEEVGMALVRRNPDYYLPRLDPFEALQKFDRNAGWFRLWIQKNRASQLAQLMAHRNTAASHLASIRQTQSDVDLIPANHAVKEAELENKFISQLAATDNGLPYNVFESTLQEKLNSNIRLEEKRGESDIELEHLAKKIKLKVAGGLQLTTKEGIFMLQRTYLAEIQKLQLEIDALREDKTMPRWIRLEQIRLREENIESYEEEYRGLRRRALSTPDQEEAS